MLPISYGPLTFQGGGGTAGGLKYKGSVAFEELPTTGQEEGDMYNITNEFILDGKKYPAGTNVAWTGTEWDALGGTVDLSGKQDIMQFSTMPTASADNLGKIIQYTGTTTSSFTQGHFYIVVSDGATTPTYSWQEISFGGEETITITYGDTSAETIAKWQILYDAANNNKPMNAFIISGNYIYVLNGIYNKRRYNFSAFVSNKSRLNPVGYDCVDGVLIISDDKVIDVSYENPQNIQFATTGYLNINYMGKNNTTAFTPTGDYNPATKKYVDDKPTTYTGYDATKTQVLKNINGTLTWVDEA